MSSKKEEGNLGYLHPEKGKRRANTTVQIKIQTSYSYCLVKMVIIHRDFIQDILLRLPVKSLVRCTCLSQEWHTFISYNKSFHSSYISRHAGRDQVLKGFFLNKEFELGGEEPVRFLPTSSEGRKLSALKKRKRHYNDDGDSLTDDNDAFPVDASLSLLGHDVVHVVGSSNGCLVTTLERECPITYMICNPLNKQQIALPKPNFTPRLVVHGFTCDAALTHYKIVRGICWEPLDYTTRLTLEIFSSDLPQWRLYNATCPFPFYLDMTLRNSAVINEGVIYMPAFREKEQTTRPQQCILIYNQSKENLQVMEMPPREDDYMRRDFFGMLDGLIAYGRYELDQLKIWLLDDKGDDRREWSPKHKVSLKSEVENYFEYANDVSKGDIDFIAFHPTNSQIFFLNCGTKKYQYNVKKSRFEFIFDLEKPGSKRAYNFFPYTYPLIGPHLFRDH